MHGELQSALYRGQFSVGEWCCYVAVDEFLQSPPAAADWHRGCIFGVTDLQPVVATAVLMQLGLCNVFHFPSATGVCSTPLLVYKTGRWCTYIGCVIINQHFIARLGSLVTFMAALSGTCCVNAYIATIALQLYVLF